MAKRFISVFIISLLLSSTFTGCTNNKTEENNQQQLTQDPAEQTEATSDFNSDEGPVSVTFLHGNESGLWFMLSNGIAETLSRTYDGSIVYLTPGSTGPNIMRVNIYQADFGFTHTNLAYEATQGIGEFDNKQENIRYIASLYPSIAQFVLKEDIGIMTMDDFFNSKPKIRISVGAAGGSSPAAFIKIIEAYGYTLEDLENWGCRVEFKNQPDGSSMMADGALDGIFMVASIPNPVISEISTNTELVMVEIDDEIIKKMVDEHAYSYAKIPSGGYNFIENEMGSFTSQTMLIASDKTSNEAAYKMTKSIYENLDYIKLIHASLSVLSPEYMINDIRIPIHPGAEMFYKEAGIID